MCELLVGLPDVDVVGVEAPAPGWLIVNVAAREQRPFCGCCGASAWVKDYRDVDLVDLPAFDQRVVLRVTRTRWCCPVERCPVGSWSLEHLDIAPAGQKLTTRAGRWATEQVGRYARSVAEVAAGLGTDWHTTNDAVVAYGEALLAADVDRVGPVRALSLDETLFMRQGRWRIQRWSTHIVDARNGQLLEVVEGRDATAPALWLDAQDPAWLAGVCWAVMDMSGPYKAVFDTMLPHAGQIIDPFHVVKHANTKLDECRRRVQNEILGHRGHKDDPLYRCRKLLLMAAERLDPAGSNKLTGLLRAGDPAARSPTRGTRRKRSGSSTTSPTPTSRTATWPSSPPTSKTPSSHPRSDPSAGP